jgi:hypothetical protein
MTTVSHKVGTSVKTAGYLTNHHEVGAGRAALAQRGPGPDFFGESLS